MNNKLLIIEIIYRNKKEVMLMKNEILDEMSNTLEENGELRLSSYDLDIYIQSVNNKEGYLYVSNTNDEFDNSKEAVKWAVNQLDGLENIDDWE